MSFSPSNTSDFTSATVTAESRMSAPNLRHGQRASEQTPLLPQEAHRTLVLENCLSALMRTLFVTPPRRWKFAYVLTVLAVTWQWYVLLMDIYLVWTAGGGVERQYISSFTESAWVFTHTVSFTLGVRYIVGYDTKERRRGYSGFLPKEPIGESLMEHVEDASAGAESPAPAVNGSADMSTRAELELSREISSRVDDGGFCLKPSTPFTSYEAVRWKYLLNTAFSLVISYVLVTTVLVLDADRQYFFDVWPTRPNYTEGSALFRVGYWLYFSGFFWGMYSSVTMCALFGLMCQHLYRAIAVFENKLAKVESSTLRLGDAVTAHEKLLAFLEGLSGTLTHWFIFHAIMLVIVGLLIIASFVQGVTPESDSQVLFWLSIGSMTLVSAFQFSYPVIAASIVSRRWEKMVVRLSRSSVWIRRGGDYQTFMIYLRGCEPEAGFVLCGSLKISGSILFQFGVLAAGLIGFIRGIS